MKPISLIRSICQVSALLLSSVFFQNCSKKSSPSPANPGSSLTITSLSVVTGYDATPVTITGTGFSTTVADDKVFFNGVAATVTGASATQIYTSVPLAAGTGKVTLTVNGSNATGPNFTYQTTEVATLLAGSGNYAFTNGTGAAASFSQDIALATDATGNIYVADQENQVIRKVTTAGVVTTFAGTGSAGSANGAATTASFSAPAGVATDAAGNIYVADSGNGFIRKITSTGQVSTLTVNGSGSAVAYGKPYFIAADAAGNVFFSDNQGPIIRELSTTGLVTTVYDGTATNLSVFGLAVDKSDNVFIVAGAQIDKLTAGSLTDFAGMNSMLNSGGANGTGTAASFGGIHGITIDGNNNLYVFDSGNLEIRMITPAAVVTTFQGPAGAYFTGPVNQVNFAGTATLAVDNQGNFYAGGNFTIRKISVQ